jgi:N-acetylglucosamine-6-phosphate deacetylase
VEFIDGSADTFLCPGLVDVHVHGAFGVDFMAADAARNKEWFDAMAARGVEALLPTTITADAKSVQAAIDALPEHPIVPGFHLEGPFISPKFPGAQPAAMIRDAAEIPAEWEAILAHPRLRYVTVAPEIPGGQALVRSLAQRGVIVSLGHTDATAAEVQEAVRHGARHVTHLFNAMRPFRHRDPGTAGAALSTDELRTELIYDRIHVDPMAAVIALRCKGPAGLLAISDGTLAAGYAAGSRVKMWGHEAVVGESDVRLLDGTLAGSKMTIEDAFENLWADFGPRVAVAAAVETPRRALGLTGPPKVWRELDASGRLIQVHRGALPHA